MRLRIEVPVTGAVGLPVVPVGSVADPNSFDPDPDQAFYLNSDPDPGF
jgi:hypothetical protein